MLITVSVEAAPILEMNKAFNALMELMPFLKSERAFKDEKNSKEIKKQINDLGAAFKLAKHDGLIKHDLFAPSYELITANLKDSEGAFDTGKKDYALWMMRETVSLCMDCHSRMPVEHTSSFQDGDLTVPADKLKNSYDLGTTYLIVRRFVDAKEQFNRNIQDKLISKNLTDIILPFQQILYIETKIMKNPAQMNTIIDDYLAKKNLPDFVTDELLAWKKQLTIWTKEQALTSGLKDEKDLKAFIKRRLNPLEKDSFNDAYKPDLLLASGILSNYFFINQKSPSAPELNYWLGWIEKRLKKEQFLSSGDLFLKQCIKKYSSHPIAKKCLSEYQESLEFDFSGSAGTLIPLELQKEYESLKRLVYPRKK